MPALTKSRDDLITRALVKIMVLGSGQSPDDEDSASVDDAIDGIFGDLSARGVVTVDNDEAIPIEWFESLADIVGQWVANDFGMPRDDTKIAMAEMALRKKTVPGPTYQVQRAEYF